MMNGIATGLLLLLFLVNILSQKQLLPIWSIGIGMGAILGIVLLLWISSKKVTSLFIGVILFFLQMIMYYIVIGDEQDKLVVHEMDQTYVICNNCLLYCRPVVYKKTTYGPFLYETQQLRSEQPIQSYRIKGDSIYISNGIREWLLE